MTHLYLQQDSPFYKNSTNNNNNNKEQENEKKYQLPLSKHTEKLKKSNFLWIIGIISEWVIRYQTRSQYFDTKLNKRYDKIAIEKGSMDWKLLHDATIYNDSVNIEKYSH